MRLRAGKWRIADKAFDTKRKPCYIQLNVFMKQSPLKGGCWMNSVFPLCNEILTLLPALLAKGKMLA